MAADMLVARHIEGEPDVKEFVAIQRSDTGIYFKIFSILNVLFLISKKKGIFALPGGMVDGVAGLINKTIKQKNIFTIMNFLKKSILTKSKYQK